MAILAEVGSNESRAFASSRNEVSIFKDRCTQKKNQQQRQRNIREKKNHKKN